MSEETTAALVACPDCDGDGFTDPRSEDGDRVVQECQTCAAAPDARCSLCRHAEHGTGLCDHRFPSWGLIRCVCRGPEVAPEPDEQKCPPWCDEYHAPEPCRITGASHLTDCPCGPQAGEPS